MKDRGPQEGLHRWVALGEADRPGVAGDIRQSQRSLDLVQVLEEPQALGQVPEQRAFFGGDAGGDEGLYAPGVVEGHQRAIAGPGQRTGAVYDPLQDGAEVEAPADAKAGLAQPGEALAQRLVFSPQTVGFFERDARPAERLRFCNFQIHGADCTTRLPKTSQEKHSFGVTGHTKYTRALYVVSRGNNRKEGARPWTRWKPKD